jgi:hypothetical protein
MLLISGNSGFLWSQDIDNGTCWHHRPWRGVKNNFWISVYSKEYTFPILYSILASLPRLPRALFLSSISTFNVPRGDRVRTQTSLEATLTPRSWFIKTCFLPTKDEKQCCVTCICFVNSSISTCPFGNSVRITVFLKWTDQSGARRRYFLVLSLPPTHQTPPPLHVVPLAQTPTWSSDI